MVNNMLARHFAEKATKMFLFYRKKQSPAKNVNDFIKNILNIMEKMLNCN
jgi:hypothetical protein